MSEIELKFQVPADRRDAVAREVQGRSDARRVRLQAAYVDTADRALAAAGIALRVRREGRQWMQTLKGAAEDGMTRAEHNVVRRAPAGSVPEADPALHADTAIGRRLLAVVDAAGMPLQVRYRTDIWRRTRLLRTPRGSVELAFDEGVVIAGDHRLPLCELEIELKGGDPLAVIETARRWVARHGLWLDTRTKAERGDLLARGESASPARTAEPPRLNEAMSPAQGGAAVLNVCLKQVAANASQVASGRFGDEHVHQWRVGLRRLRSAIGLFGDALPEGAAGPLAEAAAACFRRLGTARDLAVLAPLQDELRVVIDTLRLDLPMPSLTSSTEPADPVEVARGAAMQGLLLDVMTQSALAATAAPVADEAALRAWLAPRLDRWHRAVRRDARRFAQLDDEARHTLRKRGKRLRYAIEFVGSLFDTRQAARFAKRLRRLQNRLGVLNDASTALALWSVEAASRPGNAFAVGWLAARQPALVEHCVPAASAFVDAKRFWKTPAKR